MNDSQRQSLSHAIKAVLNDVKEFDIKFKHPFNTICTGPSQSGKSCFVKTLLHKRQIEPFPSKVILAYKEWQPLYDGVTPSLLILDDLQQEVAKNDFVSSMFMRGSYHRNCSCIFIVQNLFFQGKNARDIALNTHYYVIFRNPGDQLQIQNFARRRGQYQMIMNAYKDFCSQKHSFIIIDNSQHTDDRIKIGMPVTDLIEESSMQR